MSSLPPQQKAWLIKTGGHPSKALSRETIPVPTLEPGYVLVKVEAAALNPIGYKMMQLPNLFVKRPTVAEHDFAGTVVDGNDTKWSNGDLVFGIIPAQSKSGQGALQEYVKVSASAITLRPRDMPVTTASGIALVGQTAWESLFDIAHVQPGQSVFVNGGSSSLGSVAIQILKSKDCKVTTSCSSKNIEFVKGLGADEVLDYTTKPLAQQLSENPPSPRFHAILDCIGSWPLYFAAENYLDPNGVFVAPGSSLHGLADLPREIWGAFNALLRPTWLGGVNRTYKFMFMKTSEEKLNALSALVHEGKLKPPVDTVFAFDDVLKAYERIMAGHARGKVVVTVP